MPTVSQKDKTVSQKDKDVLVGEVLIVLDVSRWAHGDELKTLALERYMRAYLRGLTPPELEFELECLGAGLGSVVRKASKGYDRFMAKRGRA